MSTSCRKEILGLLLVVCICFPEIIRPQIPDHQQPAIRSIIIEGNKFIKKDTILRRLPYKEGESFDGEKSSDAINRLYALGYFRQIQLEKEELGANEINLYVVVEERKLLEGISFEGNKRVRTNKIRSTLELDKLETIDEEQLKRISRTIQDLYKDEHFHFTRVDYKVVVNKLASDKAKVIFTVDEGERAKIKRIYFRGCKNLPERKLRTVIFSREDWLFGLLDDSGKYNEESLETDKKRIEYVYRDHGYLMAKVARADVEFVKDDTEIDITFDIVEGDVFTIRYLSVPGDEFFSEEELLPHVTLEAGKPFSQSELVKTIDALKSQWGNIGYIHADISPQVLPNEETNEVDLTFHVDRGKKIFVDRIDITGNKITKDRVIRRELDIEEGDLLTKTKLSRSQANVEYLGFFERGSVNWKTHKLREDRADLELSLKEAKTGKFNLGATYGSDKGTSARTLRGNVQFEKANFLGRGFNIGANAQASLRRFQKGSVYFFDPHIFDTDISTGLSLYIKQEEHDQWKNVAPSPIEKTIGASTRLGFALPWISRRTSISVELGVERITNNNPRAIAAMADTLQPLLDRTFQEGDHIWLGVDIMKDVRNHRVYPSHGYKVLASFKTAPPGINRQFSFVKAEFDWSWYTPLIGEDILVLGLHANVGIVDGIVKDKIIPYKELFHIGGQDTVRGFIFGGVGPAWYYGDPLGARKAFVFNSELVFPLVPDYQMKGHVFYDAGAGWDTPKCGVADKTLIRRDHFNLRHSVGFGINLSSPFPAKIDWGYKLDRDKAAGESPHEFHISMNTAW